MGTQSKIVAGLVEQKEAVTAAEADISRLEEEGKELDCSNEALDGKLKDVQGENIKLSTYIKESKEKLSDVLEKISLVRGDNDRKKSELEQRKTKSEADNKIKTSK